MNGQRPRQRLADIAVRVEAATAGVASNERPASELSKTWALKSLPPLSVYVHVPWCVRKCPYCDFNSHAAPDTLPEAQWLDAIWADLEESLPWVWGRRVVSVFIGGGTPSLLSADTVHRLLEGLRARLFLLPDAEVTLEANPGTFEAARFVQFAQAGVNRLSVGVQSFDSIQLQQLGRVHTNSEARAAVEHALGVFPRVNVDLMYGLPSQSIREAIADVETALGLGVSHLSLYQLTLEPNTVFAKFPPEGLPDDEQSGLMQDELHARVHSLGLRRYEVSAWARTTADRARHNLNYWEFGDYLGIGPGAHAKISYHDRIERHARLKSPDSWMRAALAGDSSLAERRVIKHADLPFEFMMNALRLTDGVPAQVFAERTGLPLAHIQEAWNAAAERGWMQQGAPRLVCTARGFDLLNEVLMLFLPDEA